MRITYVISRKPFKGAEAKLPSVFDSDPITLEEFYVESEGRYPDIYFVPECGESYNSQDSAKQWLVSNGDCLSTREKVS